MSDKATQKGFRDQLGDGYVNLLDSMRHSFEQAAWGQETSGDLASDFYRWAGAEPSPEPVQGGMGEGIQVEAVEPGSTRENSPDREWAALEAWVDGKIDARMEPERGMERNGPEIGE